MHLIIIHQNRILVHVLYASVLISSSWCCDKLLNESNIWVGHPASTVRKQRVTCTDAPLPLTFFFSSPRPQLMDGDTHNQFSPQLQLSGNTPNRHSHTCLLDDPKSWHWRWPIRAYYIPMKGLNATWVLSFEVADGCSWCRVTVTAPIRVLPT